MLSLDKILPPDDTRGSYQTPGTNRAGDSGRKPAYFAHGGPGEGLLIF